MKKMEIETKENSLSESLNQISVQSELEQALSKDSSANVNTDEKNKSAKKIHEALFGELFDNWNEQEFTPQDFGIEIPIDSLESKVGYSSLFRQMHQSFIRMVAYYTSEEGGLNSIEDARRKAFHAATNYEEAKEQLTSLMRLPFQSLNFIDLFELHEAAPRVAERFWEYTKDEGRKEFESGHLAANIAFPVGYMKQVWNIARYLGVRESFIAEWQPKGGIEIALIDIMTQSYFQWQYWLEQTVKRSETRERDEHPEYVEWQIRRKNNNYQPSWSDGFWLRPTVSEKEALENAVQLADRWNRIFMRTLRQLRDLRRYSPVTINNPNQVNIATDGGQQVNVSKSENENK